MAIVLSDVKKTVAETLGQTVQKGYAVTDAVVDGFERSCLWLGHVLKVIELAPQHLPKGAVSARVVGGCQSFGQVGSVFTDLPLAVEDVADAASRVYSAVLEIFSLEAWINAAFAIRNALSGIAHTVTGLGFFASNTLVQTADAWLTFGDGFRMLNSAQDGSLSWSCYLLKTAQAVSVCTIGYFCVVGPVEPSFMLNASTVAAAIGLVHDIWVL